MPFTGAAYTLSPASERSVLKAVITHIQTHIHIFCEWIKQGYHCILKVLCA
jgi:hypothetical protein